MANRRTTKKATPARRTRVTRPVRREESQQSKGGFLDYFRLTESYASLLLGLFVVIIAAVLLIAFLQGKRNIDNIAETQETSSTQTVDNNKTNNAVAGSTYTIQAGDDLWKIAERAYNDGYKWTEIARANNITDPGMISAGQKINLPRLEKEVAQNITPTVAPTHAQAQTTVAPTTDTESDNAKTTQDQITGMTYTVAKGDYLWNIAERAYGDGYKWVDIARANNLVDPNVIHAGNVLQLPRKG